MRIRGVEKEAQLLTLEKFFLLSRKNTPILRSGSSFAFTFLHTDGRVLTLCNRFLRHGYWLMNSEVKFKRKTFNCSDRELLVRSHLQYVHARAIGHC